MPEYYVFLRRLQLAHFSLTNGSVSDVSEAFHLLETFSGTAIDDKGYVSENLRSALAEKGVRFVARAKNNMKKQNNDEKRELLKSRHKVETFIGKLKRKTGESFSRFRSWRAVSATITLGIISLNLEI